MEKGDEPIRPWKYNNMRRLMLMWRLQSFKKKYENAFEKMEESEKTIKKDGKIPKILVHTAVSTPICLMISLEVEHQRNCLTEGLILNCRSFVMILLLVFVTVKLQRLIRKGHRCYPSTV